MRYPETMACRWFVPTMRLKVTAMKLKKMVSRNMHFTIGQNPLSKIQKKKAKHLKSFAFYRGFEQIYEKEVALSIEESLQKVGMSEDLLEIKVIDSNPANNPQPPK